MPQDEERDANAAAAPANTEAEQPEAVTAKKSKSKKGKGSDVDKLVEKNRSLRKSLKKQEEKRKKLRAQDGSIPDLGNSLAAYTTLPATLDAFSPKQQHSGWKYRSRATATSVMDSHKARSLDSEVTETKSHTPRQTSKSNTKNRTKGKQPASAKSDKSSQAASAEDGDGDIKPASAKSEDSEQKSEDKPKEEEDPADALDTFVYKNFSSLMDGMTDKDKSCKGELPGKTVKEVLVAGGCTIDEEFLDEKLPADDLTDYADFLSAHKAGGVKLSNRKRQGSSQPELLGAPVVKTKLPSEIPFGDVKKARADLARAQAENRKKKQEMEYEKTQTQLSKLGFDKISGTSKTALKDAYVTYSSAPKTAKRAINNMEKKKKK